MPDNYSTIQAAVDATSPGDTIIVRDGTYTENVNVSKRNITIKSENGAEKTIVQAANPDDHVFEVTADYVNISGFTVKEATGDQRAGIYLDDVSYCNISGNNVLNNLHGIVLSHAGHSNISSNTVTDNYAGILLYSSYYNDILANTVSDNEGHGILIDETIYYATRHNNVLSNVISNNYTGIAIYDTGPYVSFPGNIISENIVMENNYGLWLYWWVTGNKIYRNNFINNQVQAKDQWYPNTPHIFDDGYPLGGNCWSDYVGVDEKSGLNQDQPGPDGIGDTPRTFPDFPGGKDNYPLMEPFENYGVGEPAKSAWPMYGHDPQHTCRSPYVGPGISENPEIKTLIGGGEGDYFCPVVIDSTGILYFEARIGGKEGLYAFYPDGSQKWFYETPLCCGSPAIGPDGTIYVLIAQNKAIMAINPDGTPRWQKSFTDVAPRIHPTVGNDGTVYFLAEASLSGAHSKLIALNGTTGEINWIYEFEGDLGAGERLPAVGQNGIIYFSHKDTLFAVNPDGTQKWQRSFPTTLADGSQLPNVSYVKSYSIGPDGTIYVVVGGESSLYQGTMSCFHALNPENPNEERWDRKCSPDFNGTPAIDAHGNIYIYRFWWDGSWVAEIYGFDPQGNILEGWPTDRCSVYTIGNLLLVDKEGNVYFNGGRLNAFDSQGNQKWGLRISTWGGAQPLSLSQDGTLYVLDRTGLYAISSFPDADSDSLPDSWENQYFGNLNQEPNNDFDTDGLTNLEEYNYGTNPTKLDTDDDGYSDKEEIDAGTNPNDPNDFPANLSPACSIKLQKNGAELDKVEFGEFFNIYVGGSTDDTGIKEVRFSSDYFQDGNPSGEWTQWYYWGISSGNWDAFTKTKQWAEVLEGSAAATGCNKEIWAEVKDDAGQATKCSANIYVNPLSLGVIRHYPSDNSKIFQLLPSFSYSPRYKSNQEITFDASWSRDGENVVYKWDFGDGNKAVGKEVKHSYSEGGLYTVTLTLDNGYVQATTSQELTILTPTETKLADTINRFTKASNTMLDGVLSNSSNLAKAADSFRENIGEDLIDLTLDVLFGIIKVSKPSVNLEDIPLLERIWRIALKKSSEELSRAIAKEEYSTLDALLKTKYSYNNFIENGDETVKSKINDKKINIISNRDALLNKIPNLGLTESNIEKYVEDLRGRKSGNVVMSNFFRNKADLPYTFYEIKEEDEKSWSLKASKVSWFIGTTAAALTPLAPISYADLARKTYEDFNSLSIDSKMFFLSYYGLNNSGFIKSEDFTQNIIEGFSQNTLNALKNIEEGKIPEEIEGRINLVEEKDDIYKITIENTGKSIGEYRVLAVYEEIYTSYELFPGAGRYYHLPTQALYPENHSWQTIEPGKDWTIEVEVPKKSSYIFLNLLGRNNAGIYLLDTNTKIKEKKGLLKKARSWVSGIFHSPGEIRVYDTGDRVTGLVNGKVKEEIPNSAYDEQNKTFVIFSPSFSPYEFTTYCYKVVGTDEGTYGLEITSVEDGETNTFSATDIPTSPGAVHEYTINWNALSEGEKGVTVKVDSNGDGAYERKVTSDSELTGDEFSLGDGEPSFDIYGWDPFPGGGGGGGCTISNTHSISISFLLLFITPFVLFIIRRKFHR